MTERIKFVKINGVVYVGIEKAEPVMPSPIENMPSGMPNRPFVHSQPKLYSPHMLVVSAEGASIYKLPGYPEFMITALNQEYSYYNNDPEFEKFFMAEAAK